MGFKWMIVLLTWYQPNVDVMRQEIPVTMTQSACEEYVTRVYEMKGWFSDPERFGFAINCQLNPNWHPKGERK